MYKFKPGDRVDILPSSTAFHRFYPATDLEAKLHDEGSSILVYTADKSDYWYVYPKDLVLHQPNEAPMKSKVGGTVTPLLHQEWKDFYQAGIELEWYNTGHSHWMNLNTEEYPVQHYHNAWSFNREFIKYRKARSKVLLQDGKEELPCGNDPKTASHLNKQTTQPKENNMDKIEITVNDKSVYTESPKKPKPAFKARKKFTATFYDRKSGSIAETKHFNSIADAEEDLNNGVAPHLVTMVLSKEYSVTKTKPQLTTVKSN